jgi:hypothetical protein
MKAKEMPSSANDARDQQQDSLHNFSLPSDHEPDAPDQQHDSGRN